MVDVRYEQHSGYRPAPLDLSQMVLGVALVTAVDALAQNEHNAWAEQLIAQGWTYGAQRVGAAQQHRSACTRLGSECHVVNRAVVGKIGESSDFIMQFSKVSCVVIEVIIYMDQNGSNRGYIINLK